MTPKQQKMVERRMWEIVKDFAAQQMGIADNAITRMDLFDQDIQEGIEFTPKQQDSMHLSVASTLAIIPIECEYIIETIKEQNEVHKA